MKSMDTTITCWKILNYFKLKKKKDLKISEAEVLEIVWWAIGRKDFQFFFVASSVEIEQHDGLQMEIFTPSIFM